MLVRDTPLGNLTLLTVFEMHDFPVLFSCRNDTEQIYLANWIETKKDSDSWLFCPISPTKHLELIRGEVDYYSVFRNSETNYLMLMKVDKGDKLIDFKWHKSSEIYDEQLPEPGDYAEVEEPNPEQDQLAPPATEIVAKAMALQHTVGRLHFDEREVADHIASTELVGRGLLEFQSVIDAVGQVSTGELTQKGAIPKRIRLQTHTYVRAFNQGSLTVELMANDTPTLFDNSVTVNSFYKTAQILAESSEYTRLQAILPLMGPRVAARYKRFLSTIKEFKADVEFEFSGAAGMVGGTTSISYEQALVAFDNISKIQEEVSERISVVGKLVGLDKSSNHFAIRDDNMKLYSGKFDEENGEFASGAVIDAEYKANLLNMLEIDTVSGKEVSRWILLGLTLVSLPNKTNT